MPVYAGGAPYGKGAVQGIDQACTRTVQGSCCGHDDGAGGADAGEGDGVVAGRG